MRNCFPASGMDTPLFISIATFNTLVTKVRVA